MAIKPISFTAPLVRLILEGKKTQTRRPLNPQYPAGYSLHDMRTGLGYPASEGVLYAGFKCRSMAEDSSALYRKAPYQPGDIMWVREPAAIRFVHDMGKQCGPYFSINFCDGKIVGHPIPERFHGKSWVRDGHGIPNGLFKEAARIFLKVTAVRVQMIHDMDGEDYAAEGVYKGNAKDWDDVIKDELAFTKLWDGVYSKRGFGWDEHPWVWVYEFEQTDKPSDWPKVPDYVQEATA